MAIWHYIDKTKATDAWIECDAFWGKEKDRENALVQLKETATKIAKYSQQKVIKEFEIV